jgi:hypothetical protein
MANVVKIVKGAVKAAKVSAAQKKNYKEKVTIPSKRMVKEAKKELKVESKALKAANKPLSKGNAKAPFKGGMSADVLKNSPPARANRERGGSLGTLRKQGKTGKTQ